MRLHNIEAVLFDSGKVLNVPQTGHWFISPKFFDHINKGSFETISIEKKNSAFSKAGAYINSIAMIKTKEEEYYHFKKYYDIFSGELPELQLQNENVKELAKDLVYNTEKYKFFDDAISVIPLLYPKYKLAVVSDAWPSLKDVFIKAGFYSYFSSFIISSVIGVTKPNEKMYLSALNELNVSPDRAVFIDDNLKNCLGAMRLGINAVLLCRDKKYYALQKIVSVGKGYSVIQSLNELLQIV
jgi:putative hydrolase of the HAD superfamily